MQRQPGAPAAQAQIPLVWPALLQLLVDAQQLVRQAAAPVVGMLGALATRAGRPPGTPSHRQGAWRQLQQEQLLGWLSQDSCTSMLCIRLLWPPASALHS